MTWRIFVHLAFVQLIAITIFNQSAALLSSNDRNNVNCCVFVLLQVFICYVLLISLFDVSFFGSSFFHFAACISILIKLCPPQGTVVLLY